MGRFTAVEEESLTSLQLKSRKTKRTLGVLVIIRFGIVMLLEKSEERRTQS